MLLVQQIVEETRKKYLESNQGPDWELRLAREFNVLPLTADWTVLFAMRPSGDIVMIPHDVENAVAEPLSDERLKNMALKQGAFRFPALASLLPQRPADALTCESCGGSGQVTALPEHLRDRIICWCGGMGWLPRTSGQMSRAVPSQTKPRRWWQFWDKHTG